jgi:CHAD domain-containing protein
VVDAKTRTLAVPGVANLQELARLMAPLGYAVRARRSAAPKQERTTFYDSWDGWLRRKGYLLRALSRADRWELLAGDTIVVAQPGAGGPVPTRGGLGDRLASFGKRSFSIPHLGVDEAVHCVRLLDSTGLPLRGEVRVLSISSVHRPGIARSAATISVDGSGDVTGAAYLGSVLRRRLGAVDAPTSLFEFGMEALDVPLPGSGVPARWAVTERDTAASACRKVAAAQLERLRNNAAGVVQDLDVEYVHEMRVAARTLRQALRLFRPLLDPADVGVAMADLAWLGKELGAVRDQDVFLASLRRELPALVTDEQGAAAAFHLVGRARDEALQGLRLALASPRYHALLAAVDRLIATEGLSAVADSAVPARRSGARAIRKGLARIAVQQDRASDTFSTEELHGIRILFRRLRYACEFYRPVFGRRLQRLLPVVVAFQDCLGGYRDATAARERLFALGRAGAEELDSGLIGALESLADAKRRVAAASRTEFAELWGAFPKLEGGLRRVVGGGRERRPVDPAPAATA